MKDNSRLALREVARLIFGSIHRRRGSARDARSVSELFVDGISDLLLISFVVGDLGHCSGCLSGGGND